MKQGFSLLELSIVLVIIGLLAGGIVGGQSLVRASEIRSLVTDSEKVRISINSFRSKYNALPGDMRNATQFWGVLAGDGSNAACQGTVATGAATCNGNGDGYIGDATVQYVERYRAWQHLANAGMIEGSYTGKSSVAALWEWQAGLNVPEAKVTDVALNWLAVYWIVGAGDLYFQGISQGNKVILLSNTSSSMTDFLSPSEAWSIDTKLDDGKPGTGKVQVYKSTMDPGCANTDVASTAEYVLTSSQKACNAMTLDM